MAQKPILSKAMRIPAFVTVLALVGGLGVPLFGQSLAEVAKQEEDRRKAVKGSGRAYSNKDLRPVPPPAAPPVSATPPTSPGSADPGSDTLQPAEQKAEDKGADKSPVKSETKDAKYWAGRMQGLREQLERDRLHAEALQSRINALTSDFAGRDDPAARSQIGVAREKAIAELERLKVAINEGTKAIAALEEEARRAAVPPGWLR